MSPSPPPRGAAASAADLPERSAQLLALLVKTYIERGEPVSSLWLARESGLGLSSATVRNTLGVLESFGYVWQPHTSAGRVPTDLGYRFFVDTLLSNRRSQRSAPDTAARLWQAGGSVTDVLSTASHELSRVSHHVGFAVGPADDGATLRHIEFVSLDASRLLVIIVATTGEVVHKAIDGGDPLSPSELNQAANYLNREFSGMTVGAIREAVVSRLRQERVLYDRLLARALRLASRTLADLDSEPRLYVAGTSSLLEQPLADDANLTMETLRALIAMMEEKHRLVRLLTEYIDGPGVTVIIGHEHTSPDLRKFSLVASMYSHGSRAGTVGVIGPTRMRYSRAIAVVDSLSQAVTHLLGGEGGTGRSQEA
jgi:heat-inducible transcriptional repressor